MLDVSEAGGDTRNDANLERLKAFRDAGNEAKQEYFNNVYGDDQIHLQILGTHPDSMRRGFGASLCAWGMSKARADGLVVSVLASPMGFLLYSRLNFQDLGTVMVQVPGDEEKVSLKPMVFQPEKDSARVDL